MWIFFLSENKEAPWKKFHNMWQPMWHMMLQEDAYARVVDFSEE